MARKIILVILALLLLGNLAAAPLAPARLACEDERKDKGYPRFARLMHDPQWMDYPSRIAAPDWPKTFYLRWYPETVKLSVGPKSGESRLVYSRQWLEFLRDVQPNDNAAVWITRVAAGLFNKGNPTIPILDLDSFTGTAVAESISAGGNVMKVLQVKNGSARLEMFYFRNAPPDPENVNYQTQPWLITKLTAVSIDGQLGNAGGIDVYFPNLARNRQGYWVDVHRIEMFPQTPFCAVALTSRTALSEPRTGYQVGSVSSGQPITIREYMPQASNVWGRIDQGWILLEYLDDKGVPVYTTTWSMETRPPILLP